MAGIGDLCLAGAGWGQTDGLASISTPPSGRSLGCSLPTPPLPAPQGQKWAVTSPQLAAPACSLQQFFLLKIVHLKNFFLGNMYNCFIRGSSKVPGNSRKISESYIISRDNPALVFLVSGSPGVSFLESTTGVTWVTAWAMTALCSRWAAGLARHICSQQESQAALVNGDQNCLRVLTGLHSSWQRPVVAQLSRRRCSSCALPSSLLEHSQCCKQTCVWAWDIWAKLSRVGELSQTHIMVPNYLETSEMNTQQ